MLIWLCITAIRCRRSEDIDPSINTQNNNGTMNNNSGPRAGCQPEVWAWERPARICLLSGFIVLHWFLLDVVYKDLKQVRRKWR